MYQSVLEQDTEPQIAPDGRASALHGSSAGIGVWMGESEATLQSALSGKIEKCYVNAVHLPLVVLSEISQQLLDLLQGNLVPILISHKMHSNGSDDPSTFPLASWSDPLVYD